MKIRRTTYRILKFRNTLVALNRSSIVVEGRDKDVLKDPNILRTMEKFQREFERDPDPWGTVSHWPTSCSRST